MNIGFIFNVRHVKPDMNSLQYIKEAEFDEPSTIEGIRNALKKLGHNVVCIEADKNLFDGLKYNEDKIDIVFNIAEGLGGADREAQVPAILEMFNIPYTGPKPLGYAVGLNKAVAKEILSYYKINTPKWVTASSVEELKTKFVNFFPAIAKPLSEGSSKGIFARNLVKNQEELYIIAQELLQNISTEIIVEEFLPGREFTVAVIGNPPRVLPIIEVLFNNLPNEIPKFDHFEAKWVYDNPESKHNPLSCPASLDDSLKSKIEKICIDSFDALEMADWARFDLRLDKNNEPSFIEVNCPPGIIPDPKENSRFPLAARAAGFGYEQMIEEILKSACKRYNIEYKK